MAQDDYYYEIQLTNKQLVFYFMAGATGLILSFLAGVMVGRGVDSEVQAARPPAQQQQMADDKLVEEPVKPAPATAEDLTYAKQLEGDKLDDTLEKPGDAARTKAEGKPAAASARVAANTPPARPAEPPPPAEKPAARPAEKPAAPEKQPARLTEKPPAPAAAGGVFTIQVGAFKDRSSAETVVSRLKGKGFAAYVNSPAAGDGLFNVRVGNFQNRPDAERVQNRLRDDEKFKPFIVRN